MRVVFMGTPAFAVPSLVALDEAFEVLCVYTRPDAVSSRGSTPAASPVKQEASRRGIPVAQPASLRSDDVVDALARLRPDVVVVAAYGAILPPSVLAVPLAGCVNVHASLLPRWRGAAPVQRAILAGDPETGVCIMRMEEGLDTGPWCACAAVGVDDKTATALTEELAVLGAGLLVKVLPDIVAGRCEWHPQTERDATYAPKILKPDVALTPEVSAEELVLRVRASTPAAPARFVLGGRGATVLEAGLSRDAAVASGHVAADRERLLLGTAEGTLAVSRLRPDGKRDMDASAWARGLRLSGDEQWGSPR